MPTGAACTVRPQLPALQSQRVKTPEPLQGPVLPQSGFPTRSGGCGGHRLGGYVRCPHTQLWCLQGLGEVYGATLSSPGPHSAPSFELTPGPWSNPRPQPSFLQSAVTGCWPSPPTPAAEAPSPVGGVMGYGVSFKGFFFNTVSNGGHGRAVTARTHSPHPSSHTLRTCRTHHPDGTPGRF